MQYRILANHIVLSFKKKKKNQKITDFYSYSTMCFFSFFRQLQYHFYCTLFLTPSRLGEAPLLHIPTTLTIFSFISLLTLLYTKCLVYFSNTIKRNRAIQYRSLSNKHRESNFINIGSAQLSSIQSLSRVSYSLHPMNCSTRGLLVHHQLPEFTQTHIHRVSDAIQPSHPRSSPSPPAPNPSQHQSLFQ